MQVIGLGPSLIQVAFFLMGFFTAKTKFSSKVLFTGIESWESNVSFGEITYVRSYLLLDIKLGPMGSRSI